jgi:hypothetical protein
LTKANDESEWLAIDGKTLRSTLENYGRHQQNFLSIISVFCQDNGLVLPRTKIENKPKSEIHHVQDTVRTSGLTQKVFTGDALHCQKQTINLITGGGNNYFVAAKNNSACINA